MKNIRFSRVFLIIPFIILCFSVIMFLSNRHTYSITFHLEKAKLFKAQDLVNEAVKEIILQKEFIYKMSISEKYDYYKLIADMDCEDCSSETLQSFYNFSYSIIPEFVLLAAKLDTPETQLQRLDVMYSIIQMKKFKTANSINYETALIINQMNESIEILNLDEMDPYRINIKSLFLLNGTCSYDISNIDKRCSKFKEPDFVTKNTFVENVLDNYNKKSFESIIDHKELFSNISSEFLNLIGRIAVENIEYNLNHINKRIAKKLSPLIEDYDDSDKIINFLNCEGEYCRLSIFEFAFFKLQNELENGDTEIITGLENIISAASLISDEYELLGNSEKQLFYYSEFLDYILEFMIHF